MEGPVILFWIVFVLGTAIVNIAFAFGVYKDTTDLYKYTKRKPFLVSGEIWALATLFGGVFAAGVYWLIHHSMLDPFKPVENNSEEIVL